jgi:hypothetical protein
LESDQAREQLAILKGMRYDRAHQTQLALISCLPEHWRNLMRPLALIPPSSTLLRARREELKALGLEFLEAHKKDFDFWNGDEPHVRAILRALLWTDHPLMAIGYDAKGVKSSLRLVLQADGTAIVQGLMYDMTLDRREAAAAFVDQDTMWKFKQKFGGEAVRAIFTFVLNSGDWRQSPIVLAVIESTSGSVTGVSGLEILEAQLKEMVPRLVQEIRAERAEARGVAFAAPPAGDDAPYVMPIVSCADGDRANRGKPRSLKEATLDALVDDDGFLDLRLAEYARQLPENLLFMPDTLHYTKVEVNTAMPEGKWVVIAPTVDWIVRIRQLLLACGVPAPNLNRARKMHDQNPIVIAEGDFCRAALRIGRPEALAWLVPIILSVRGLRDVEAREVLLDWQTVDFCFALLQIVLKDEPEARAFGWKEANTRGNHGVYVQSTETGEKVMASRAVLSLAIAFHLGEVYTGFLTSMSVEHVYGALTFAAHGDLSPMNLAMAIAHMTAERAFIHKLGYDASMPGRLSERRTGAKLPAVDNVDLSRCMTIGQGIEAAFEILEFALEKSPEKLMWPEVLGSRPDRIFPTIDDLLRWLPKPIPKRIRKTQTTEQLGLTTATSWAILRVTLGQHALFAGGDFSDDDDNDGDVEERDLAKATDREEEEQAVEAGAFENEEEDTGE